MSELANAAMGKIGQIQRTPKWLRSRNKMPLLVEWLPAARILLRYLCHFDASKMYLAGRDPRDLFDCARYHINLRVTCRSCGHSTVLDAAGHWWACHKSGKSEAIAAFVKRLYCKKCIGPSGEKRRYFKVEQTREPPDGPLLPGPDEYEWKRFVSGQRR